nr:Ycf2 [Zanthoxylum ailanthoides]ULF02627.1 Ycf2 [Zanthoxylum ailanthoides]
MFQEGSDPFLYIYYRWI